MEFEDVAAEHGRALVRVAYLLCHDSGRAEDLAQEALMKALTRWQRHGAPDHPAAYLRRIVVTEYLGWRRKRASTEVVVDDLTDAAGSGPDAVADVDARDLAWRAMAALPAKQRAVLVLRYYEGLPDREIATLVGVGEGTVRSLASRAFATLRTHPDLADFVSAGVVGTPRDTKSGEGVTA